MASIDPGRTKVKICGMRSLPLALLALEMGASYIGMIHHSGSPRYLELGAMALLARELPEGCRVAVVVEPTVELLRKLLDSGVDCVQIHSDLSNLDQLFAWNQVLGRDRMWLAPRRKPGSQLPPEWSKLASLLLIDTYRPDQHGGTGMTGDWEDFSRLRAQHPEITMMLAGGLNAGNVVEAIVGTQAGWIDLSSGVESAPGVKDPLRIRQLFERLRVAGMIP
jgi:phosphoribosylanthranilate isomerase